jgi:hypothetical protein
LAKPVLELDSHAKVQMRSKIRALRAIEREVLKERAAAQTGCAGRAQRSANTAATATKQMGVVLDYCAAVRGIINDSQGGPLRPPGLRMSEALGDVRRSLGRNLRLKKGDTRKRC